MAGGADFNGLIEAAWSDGVGHSAVVKTFLSRFEPEAADSRDFMQMADELLALSLELGERVHSEEISRQTMKKALMARFPTLSEEGVSLVMQRSIAAAELGGGAW